MLFTIDVGRLPTLTVAVIPSHLYKKADPFCSPESFIAIKLDGNIKSEFNAEHPLRKYDGNAFSFSVNVTP